MAADQCEGGILTFESTHPKWSYVKTREDGFVSEVAEKKIISNKATAGVYFYKKGSDFVQYAERMVAKGEGKIGENFYVCPVYNELINAGKKIKIFDTKKVWKFGSPEELNDFLKNNENIFA